MIVKGQEGDGFTIDKTDGRFYIKPVDTPKSDNQVELQREITELGYLLEAERARQFRKFGDQYHTVDQWVSIIQEEWGESVGAWNKDNLDEAVEEGIQTIMCIVQYLHELLRLREGKKDGEYTRQK